MNLSAKIDGGKMHRDFEFCGNISALLPIIYADKRTSNLMSHGIHIRLHLPVAPTEREGEPTAHAGNRVPDVLPTASGNEHGAIFFNLDWQNQQADSRRQQINETLYSNNQFANGNQNNSNLPEVVIETARSIVEPEKLPEKVIEHARDKVEQNYRQTESTARDAHQTVEQRKAEVEPKKQHQTQSDSPRRENQTQTRNADSHAQTQTQSPPRNEQTASTAHNQNNQTTDPKNVREPINQTAAQTSATTTNNATRAEKTTVNPRSGEPVPTETAKETAFVAAKTLTAKNVPLNLNEAARSEFAARDASNSLPKTANANPLFAETATTRVLNQQSSETAAANNSAARHENGVPIGGALINGSATEIEDYPQFENIQVGGFGAENDFYDAAGNVFAAGAWGALMSATVGSVVPSASGAVSGVLGFVSGIVVGTEIEPALRWLSSDKADAANNLLTAKVDDSTSETFDLQLGYA